MTGLIDLLSAGNLFIGGSIFSAITMHMFLSSKGAKDEAQMKARANRVPAGAPSNTAAPPSSATPRRSSHSAVEPFKGVYGLPEPCAEHSALVQQHLQTMRDAYHGQDGVNGWEKLTTKNDVEIYRKVSSNQEPNLIMGKGIVNGPPRAVMDILYSARAEVQRKIDHAFDQNKDLQAYNNHWFCQWSKYKAPFPVTPRDFLTQSYWQVDDDGAYLSVGWSVDSHPECPPPKKTVRGVVHLAGWRIAPAGEMQSHITYVAKVDLGGSFPAFLVNQLGETQPLQIYNIQKILAGRNLSVYGPGGARSEVRNGVPIVMTEEEENKIFA